MNAPPENGEALAGKNEGSADYEQNAAVIQFPGVKCRYLGVGHTGAFPFHTVDEDLGWCEPNTRSSDDNTEEVARQSIGLAEVLRAIDDGVTGGPAAMMQRRFVNFIAICHLVRAPFIERGLEHEGLRAVADALCISHETLRKAESRMMSALGIDRKVTLAPEHLHALRLARERRAAEAEARRKEAA